MEPFTNSVFVALLNGVWQAVVLFLVLWFVFRVLRIGNATTRYAVWSLALLFVLALPPMNLLIPARELPSSSLPAETTTLKAKTEPGRVVVTRPRGEPVETDPRARPFVEWTEPTLVKELQVVETESVTDSSALTLPVQVSPGRWSLFLSAAWCAIASALLFRVFWSFRRLSFLKRTSKPVDERYDGQLRHWKALSGSRRAVTLRCSNQVSGPMAAGLVRPVILLPCALMKKLSDEELDQVGLHEMAHLSRWDDWTKLSQKFLEAIFFFNPAVHWIGRQLDLEREMACDDWVIARTGKPKTYAACLTRLIELTGRLSAPILAPGGWTTRKQIARRIEMTVKRSHPVKSKVSTFGLLISLFVLFFVGIQCARTSPLVAAPAQEEVTTQEKSNEEPLREEQVAEVQEREKLLPEEALEEELAHRQQMEAERQLELERLQALEEREHELRAFQLREEEEIREQMMRDQFKAMERELALAKEGEFLTSERHFALAGEEGLFSLPVLGFPAPSGFGNKSAIPEDELVELMEEIAENDTDLKVQKAAIKTLATVRSEAAAEALIRLYDSLSNVELKKAIVSALGFSQKLTPNVTTKLKEIVRGTTDSELRKKAVMSLARLPGNEGAEALASIYDSSHEVELRKSIVRYLSISRSDVAVEKLKDIARSDSDAELRLMAVRSLGNLHRGFAVSGIGDEPYLFAEPADIEFAPEPPNPPKPPRPKR
jgi:beta-lactamase regulating signal transducer with metallopeptidase domain/HEAT repeat protein